MLLLLFFSLKNGTTASLWDHVFGQMHEEDNTDSSEIIQPYSTNAMSSSGFFSEIISSCVVLAIILHLVAPNVLKSKIWKLGSAFKRLLQRFRYQDILRPSIASTKLSVLNCHFAFNVFLFFLCSSRFRDLRLLKVNQTKVTRKFLQNLLIRIQNLFMYNGHH